MPCPYDADCLGDCPTVLEHMPDSQVQPSVFIFEDEILADEEIVVFDPADEGGMIDSG